MPALIWILIILVGLLFAFKMTYILCTAIIFPVTKGALYVSTSRSRISAFLDAVPMNASQYLFDLGCGDGRVLREARKRYGVRAVGYEVNLLAYLKARLKSLRYQGIEIKRRNFWTVDLYQADVVFCYLFPDVLKTLAHKMKSELKPGAVIVSCNFSLPEFTPERILRPNHKVHNDPIYIYRICGDQGH